jgi:hypothetical protein
MLGLGNYDSDEDEDIIEQTKEAASASQIVRLNDGY